MNKRAVRNALQTLTLITAIAGCASHPPPSATGGQPISPESAIQAQRAGDYAKAAKLYLRLAQTADKPSRRAHWRLQAALNAYRAGRVDQSRELIGRIDSERLSDADQALYRLAQTLNRTDDQLPAARLQALPRPDASTPDRVAARIQAARANAEFAAGRPLNGIRSLIERGKHLSAKRVQFANKKEIFDHALALRNIPTGQELGRTEHGWLRLAAIARRAYPSAKSRTRAISGWVSSFPDHPANGQFLARTLGFSQSQQERARRLKTEGGLVHTNAPSSQQVALALPLSGRHENAANAIRAGYLFAAHHAGQSMPAPLVWNTNQLSLKQLSRRMTTRNVGILVGPLRKPKVTALARQTGATRIIALNRSTRPVKHRNFYQFGLAPGDASRAAAQRALNNLGKRALVLVPNTDRGRRILKAFRARFRQGGGTVVASAFYQPGGDDHGIVINRLLGAYNFRRGINPRRIDFIFVTAIPRQGRLIRTQLNYNHASGLPMVATGLIYSGSPKPDKDIDLNGVYFVDMPWRIGRGEQLDRLTSQAKAQYPKASHYPRLFALGIDSYRLAARMAQKGLGADVSLNGVTGHLYIDNDGVIHRQPTWARFVEGAPKLLSKPTPAYSCCR